MIDLEMAKLRLSNEKLLNYSGVDGFDKEGTGVVVASEDRHNYGEASMRK